jgi:hypothetical protein
LDKVNEPEPLDFIQDLAVNIGKWFPELKGRSLGVSDARPSKDNLVSLPIAMTSFANEVTEAGRRGGTSLTQRSEFSMIDTIVVEFWLAPLKETTLEGGAETPFWTYYSYERIRDRLLTHLTGYQGPRKQQIRYVGLGQETTEYAIVLVFTFQAYYEWCADEEILQSMLEPGDGDPINCRTFDTRICEPQAVYCPEDADTIEETEKKCP